jgi:CubicO group peptidase (beta-lactamase class C family)
MTSPSVTPPAGVGALLSRAVEAGLGVGWVALAAREGQEGTCWMVGSAAVGGPPVAPDTLYDLASLTKPLATGTLLLLACRDGVPLEAPLAEVLPELGDSPWASATLAQCATHTAGFPAWAPLYALGERSREGALGALARLEPVAPPGRRLTYSCPGFIALGLALERCGGADLATLFRDLVGEPLGLAEELAFAPPLAAAAAAAGQSEPFVERALLAERGLAGAPPAASSTGLSCDDGNARSLGGAAGNAGLFGTASAVAQLAAEYLPGGGELLTAGEAALATRTWTAGFEQARGLAWQLATTPGCAAGPALSPAAFGHNGFTGTSLWVDPDERVVLVLLGNRLHPGGRTPDLHPLRRRLHALALGHLRATGALGTIGGS